MRNICCQPSCQIMIVISINKHLAMCHHSRVTTARQYSILSSSSLSLLTVTTFGVVVRRRLRCSWSRVNFRSDKLHNEFFHMLQCTCFSDKAITMVSLYDACILLQHFLDKLLLLLHWLRLQSWLMPQSPHRLRNDLKCVKCAIQSNPLLLLKMRSAAAVEPLYKRKRCCVVMW